MFYSLKAKMLALGCGALSVQAVYYWQNIYNVEQVVKQHQFKDKDLPAEISENVKGLFATVMNNMKLNEKRKSLIKPFVINDLLTKHFGFSGHKPGTFVGIPKNFVFEVDEINFENLPLKVDLSKLEPSDYNILKSNLTLSEKAKKFAIAQEIYKSSHLSFYGQSFLALISFAIFYGVILLTEKIKPKKVEKYKFLYFMHLTLTVSLLYITSIRIMNDHQLVYSDISAAKLGNEYIEGGLEYLEKMSEVYKLLRKSEYIFQKLYNNIFHSDTNTECFKRRLDFLRDLEKDNNRNDLLWKFIVRSMIMLS